MALPRERQESGDELEIEKTGVIKDEKTTEQSRAAEFHGAKNRASRQKAIFANDPESETELELERLSDSTENDSAIDSSVSARRAQDGGIIIDLETGVRIPTALADQDNSPTRQGTSHSRMRTPRDTRKFSVGQRSPRSFSLQNTPEALETDLNELESQELSPEESYDPFTEGDGQWNPNNEYERVWDQTKQQEVERKIDDEQRTERELKRIEENRREEESNSTTTGRSQNQQTDKQNAQLQARQMQIQQQQSGEDARTARATQIKQRLDRQMSSYKGNRRIFKMALRSVQIFKAIIDVIQKACTLLADVIGLIPLIGWLLAGFFYVIYGLLWLIKGPLVATISLLKNKIKSLDAKIEKTEKLQKKATDVIQSIQRQKRTVRTPQQMPPGPAPTAPAQT